MHMRIESSIGKASGNDRSLAMPFVGNDSRPPGDKWIRTEFGWKRPVDIRNNVNIHEVQHFRHLSSSSSSAATTTSSNSTTNSSSRASSRQLSRRGSPVGDAQAKSMVGSRSIDYIFPSYGRSDSKASCSHQSKKQETKQGAWEREQRLRQLRLMLDQRCVSASTNSQPLYLFPTFSEVISKLNFHQALHDENCFPFICKVIKLMLEKHYTYRYWTLREKETRMGIGQTLLRIIDTAKNIAIETRMHTGLVLKMTEAALTTLDKNFYRRHLMPMSMGFHVHRDDLKSLLKNKKQLQEQMLEYPCLLKPGDMEFTKLPTDCLRLVVSHLSHPRDVLNLGQADVRLHRMTEESWMWRELTQHHYGEVNIRRCRPAEFDESANYTGSWKHIFIQKYKDTHGRLKGETFRAVCLCKTCSYVYWKDYGHPCSGPVQPKTNAAVDGNHADSAAAASGQQEQAQGLTAEQFLRLYIRDSFYKNYY